MAGLTTSPLWGAPNTPLCSPTPPHHHHLFLQGRTGRPPKMASVSALHSGSLRRSSGKGASLRRWTSSRMVSRHQRNTFTQADACGGGGGWDLSCVNPPPHHFLFLGVPHGAAAATGNPPQPLYAAPLPLFSSPTSSSPTGRASCPPPQKEKGTLCAYGMFWGGSSRCSPPLPAHLRAVEVAVEARWAVGHPGLALSLLAATGMGGEKQE